MRVLSKRLIFTSVAACAVLLTNAFAEKEGAYFGVEVGANKVNFKQKIYAVGMGEGNIEADNVLPSIGVKGGYKWFFSRDFGVRTYAALGVGYGQLKDVKYDGSYQQLELVQSAVGFENSVFPTTNNGYFTTFIDYYVGADLLYNFAADKKTSYGLFAGLGLGGVTWIANGDEYEVSNGDRTYIDLQVNLNLGFRMNMDDKHGIEFGGRYYFPKSKIFEANGGISPLMPTVPIIYTETKHSRPFSVLLSYIYSF